MVSLLITRLGRTIARGKSGADIYDRLSRSGYLSALALQSRAEVIALIDRSAARFSPWDTVGQELWRHIQTELGDHNYLSSWARWWGMRPVRRD